VKRSGLYVCAENYGSEVRLVVLVRLGKDFAGSDPRETFCAVRALGLK